MTNNKKETKMEFLKEKAINLINAFDKLCDKIALINDPIFEAVVDNNVTRKITRLVVRIMEGVK